MSTDRSWSHYLSWLAAFAVVAIFAGVILPLIAGWTRSQRSPSSSVILATLNTNHNCIGHNWTEHVCTDNRYANAAIAAVFATEPDCQGVRVRGLTDREGYTPGNQIPNLLSVYYDKDPATGTGMGETQSWTFYGPHGTVSATTRTQEMVRMVCWAARGLGADMDNNLGP